MTKALIALTLVFQMLVVSFGATYPAASPSKVDVLAAIAFVTTTNDIVTIPAGTAIWTNRTDITKSFTLQGAGTNAFGSDYTHIIITAPGDYGLDFRPAITNDKVRVTAITFEGTNCYSSLNFGNNSNESLAAYKYSVWEVDYCHFIMNGNRAINANSPCYSVAHNNMFSGFAQATAFNVFGRGGSNTYSGTIQYGTLTVPYFENNLLIWDAASSGANGGDDCYAGAQFVVRFNLSTNVAYGGHGVDSGGFDLQSPFGGEFYGNTNVLTTGIAAWQFRGGNWLWYSNKVTSSSGSSSGDIIGYHYRTSGTNIYGGTDPCCAPFGPTYPTNKFDGGELGIGWPSLQQIGVTGPIIYGPTNTTQNKMMSYYWNNTYNGLPSGFIVGNNFTNSGTSGGYNLALIPSASQILIDGRDVTNKVYSYTIGTYPHPLTTITTPSTNTGAALLLGKPIILGKSIIR